MSVPANTPANTPSKTPANAAADPIAQALLRPPAGPVHLVPFIPAGYGGFETTAATLAGVAEAGASVIEVGIPFSDPIADGPTIQAAYHEALQQGATLQGLFDMVSDVRKSVACPMLAMVSYSVVFRGRGRSGLEGVKTFCQQTKAAGFEGLLCPDLPPPEAGPFCGIARAAGLAPILLVAPTTTPRRRDEIGRLGGGFIYYQSIAGITGERDALPPELTAGVADMKGRTDLPVCVGFGISRPQHVQSLAGTADGAIVGSAFVRRMQQHAAEGPQAVGRACREFARTLLGG